MPYSMLPFLPLLSFNTTILFLSISASDLAVNRLKVAVVSAGVALPPDMFENAWELLEVDAILLGLCELCLVAQNPSLL